MASLRKQVKEVVTCPISLDDLKDPRSLPCLHSFCFQCLQRHYEDMNPGDDVSCPVCRSEFQIPQGGLNSLPRNFFLQNLIEAKDMQNTETGTLCDEHPDQRLELYCIDCATNICMKCFAVSHQQHKCAEVEKQFKDFAAQINSDIEPFSSRISQFHESVKKIEMVKEKFLQTVEKIEHRVQQRGNEIKRLVDYHVAELIQELNEVKERSVKEANLRLESIEVALAALESFQAYSLEIASKGTPYDITRSFNELHIRAEELLKSHVIANDYSPPVVQFVPREKLIKGLHNIVGAVKSATPTLTDVIPSQGGAGVTAMTSLGDDVFVARWDSKQVEVYDATTLTLQRRLTVSGLGKYLSGLAACPNNNCLYASDNGQGRIHRVQLSGRKSVKKWNVNIEPACLSVNNEDNLIVADLENKLHEYTTYGSLVREICLQAGVTRPSHAIQLSTGDYVVSQCTSPGVVSVVGVDGYVVRSCEPSQASDVGPMNNPSSLAVTKNDNILVADEWNNRILSIDSSLGSVQDLGLLVDGGIQQPLGLCLDESRGRLYVGEYEGEHRVLVFDDIHL